MRSYVFQHREGVGWLLLGCVLAVMALDYILGASLEVGRLLPLRLAYALLSVMIVSYVYILATAQWQPARRRP